MPLRVGSLFSGIGGLDLGLQQAGMEIAWQAEVDAWCREVLAAHWPNIPRMGDIRAVDFDALPRVDVLSGGFPCQPVSHAGRRRGQGDERWMWPEFARAVRAVHPRYVLIENVPGLVTFDRMEGHDQAPFEEVLGDLAACGYDAEWQVLPASAVGARHERRRLFIVAYPNSTGLARLHEAERRIYLQSTFGQARRAVAERSQQEWEAEPDLDRMAYGLSAGLDGDGHGGGRQGEDLPVDYYDYSQWLESVRRAGWTGIDGARLAYGFPAWLDKARLHGLGDAVVPAMGELVGRLIVADCMRQDAAGCA